MYDLPDLQRILYRTDTPNDLWFDEQTLRSLGAANMGDNERLELYSHARKRGIDLRLLDSTLKKYAPKRSGNLLITPSSALMVQAFPPITYFVDRMFPQGLVLLAGKSKRGKTYLCLDLALSISQGIPALQTMPTHQGRVLFVSLEDGARLVQKNLATIAPMFQGHPALDFAYEFPIIGEGAAEEFAKQLEHYDVIFLDILGRIMPRSSSTARTATEYQVVQEALGPLHDLVRDRDKMIVFLDHTRKAPSEDVFDTIMGSAGKQGTVDTVLVYTRGAGETEGTLHGKSKINGENTIVMRMVDGHLEYLGEGEEYEQSSERRKLLEVMEDENRPMRTNEIVQAMGLDGKHYHRVRQLLYRMYKEESVSKTDRGLWALVRRMPYGDEPF